MTPDEMRRWGLASATATTEALRVLIASLHQMAARQFPCPQVLNVHVDAAADQEGVCHVAFRVEAVTHDGRPAKGIGPDFATALVMAVDEAQRPVIEALARARERDRRTD